MSDQPTNDDERLQELIKEVSDADTKNSEAFDKAILTLSSGALALSLAFVKDIVSPTMAEYNFLLYASWFCFILALAVVVAGFMRAFWNSRKLRGLLFNALRHRTEPEDQVQPLMDKHLNEVYRTHFLQGALFLIGASVFTLYVMLNFEHEATMTKSKHDPTSIDRARPSASFFPQSSKQEVVMALDAAPSANFMPKTQAVAKPSTAGVATAPAAAATAASAVGSAGNSPQQRPAGPTSQ